MACHLLKIIRQKRTPKELFFRHVLKLPGSNACWYWVGAIHPVTGYGLFGYEGRTQRAHRVIWILTSGAIPDGLWVLHKCDNRRCVNPAHLFLGTQQDNTDDMVAKGRVAKQVGETNGFAKLTSSDVLEIRAAYAKNYTPTELAKTYGCNRKTISLIVHRQTWKHLGVANG